MIHEFEVIHKWIAHLSDHFPRRAGRKRHLRRLSLLLGIAACQDLCSLGGENKMALSVKASSERPTARKRVGFIFHYSGRCNCQWVTTKAAGVAAANQLPLHLKHLHLIAGESGAPGNHCRFWTTAANLQLMK